MLPSISQLFCAVNTLNCRSCAAIIYTAGSRFPFSVHGLRWTGLPASFSTQILGPFEAPARHRPLRLTSA